MSVNLIRNARVFLTTNVSPSTKKVLTTGFLPANTFEIQVLDGLSFSQNTGAEQVTVSEAGDTPMRGQRSFNTTLEPVDWSFSTYLRPKWTEGTPDAPDTLTAGDRVTAEEDCLWKCFASYDSATFTTGTTAFTTSTVGTAWNEIVSDGTAVPYAWWNLKNSDKNQLVPFGLVIIFDNVTFLIHNCAIESVSIDFGIDAIATGAWSGKGTQIEKLANTGTLSDGTFGGGLTGTYRQKYTDSRYIANKLSQIKLSNYASVYGQAGTSTNYNIPITGGNITIANNLTYLTPATVGVVNQPFEYFTGTRTVTGNVTAYLRSGNSNTAELIQALTTQSILDDENMFDLEVSLGGSVAAENKNKVVLKMPRTMLQIPNISTDQVVSTTINFMPQSYGSGNYTLDSANEVTLTYYSGPAL